jgi:hypothetical protein
MDPSAGIVLLGPPLEGGGVCLEDYAQADDLRHFQAWEGAHLPAAEVRRAFPSGIVTHRAWTGDDGVTYRWAERRAGGRQARTCPPDGAPG